jgi:hypothetical protein
MGMYVTYVLLVHLHAVIQFVLLKEKTFSLDLKGEGVSSVYLLKDQRPKD